MNIVIKPNPKPKDKPDFSNLGFGQYFSDNMFLLDYENGVWKNPRIEAYGTIPMEPGASVFHYGQALFEGMKVFKGDSGKTHLYRPEFHIDRMAKGAARLCMPSPPSDIFYEAIKTLVKLDDSWIPKQKGSALYLRPTLIGTESFLGVRPSEKYLFFIITSPVGAYYSEGFSPVKIWIEESTTRAAPGGLGAIKAAANYAASLQASTLAKKKGFSQVLWLDGAERKYIEEVGTMNVFFHIGNEVITPALDGTILAGSTRDCVIQILKDWQIPVVQRKIRLEEVATAHQNRTLKEVFGTGTAAVISSVGELSNDKMKLVINNSKAGDLTQKLYEEITSIQYGLKPDRYNWVKILD